MGDNQSRRGQVDTMAGAIVTRSRRFEGMTAEDRQFVITNPDLALDLFMRAVRDREILLASAEQIAALKYLIAKAHGGSNFLKQLLFVLIDRSEMLTKEVYITLEPTEDLDGKTIHDHAVSSGALVSCNCTTHLDQVMIAMGTGFRFSFHYGHYDPDGKFNTTGQLAGFPGQHENDPTDMPTRYTFWLARGSYGNDTGPLERVEVKRVEIEAVDLSRPGLYPDLENQRY